MVKPESRATKAASMSVSTGMLTKNDSLASVGTFNAKDSGRSTMFLIACSLGT